MTQKNKVCNILVKYIVITTKNNPEKSGQTVVVPEV